MARGERHEPPDGFRAPQSTQTLTVSVPYEPSPYMRRFLRWSVSATNRALRLWSRWPCHTAKEVKAAKAAGRPVPAREEFNAYERMVYGETKDRAGQFAVMVAAGIARRAEKTIAEFRRDHEANCQVKRPKQMKPHVYLDKQIIEYDWDNLVMHARVGSETSPHVEHIPLTRHAVALIRNKRLGEPLIGDGEVVIPYKANV